MLDEWGKSANIRRRQIESGADLTFSKVFVPYYVRLVAALRPSSLLEVGCGTGHLSAALSPSVRRVVAVEPSLNMYTVAKNVLYKSNVQVLCSTAEDYTDGTCFDLIISHMCVQTIEEVASFLDAVRRHMEPTSLFVFSIPHPCFYNSYKHFFADGEYQYMRVTQKMITFTITREPETAISDVPYHHRPISRYCAYLQEQELCVAQFDEIFPEPNVQELYGQPWIEPRYCVFHCRRRGRY